jgi:hypothetical protein
VEIKSMRNLGALSAVAAFVGLGMVVPSGCFDLESDCSLFDCNAIAAGGTSASSSQSSGAHGGTSTGPGGAGGGGGTSSSSSSMTNCDPTMGAVDGSCGIFVSSSMGHDADEGSKSNPVKTLAHAIDLAATNGSRVYACAEEYDEAVVMPAGTSLYGALDCAHGWAYAASTPSSIVAPADQVALTIAGGASTSLVQDFSITAADATVASGSSVGVLTNADLELDRVSITSGAGKDGDPGMAQTQVAPGANGDNGTDDVGCVMTSGIIGGSGGSQMCGGTDVSGGSGGIGVTSGNGGSGTAGSGTPGSAPFDGAGGTGQAVLPCVAGDAGGNGTDGATGSGAPALGTLTPAGYTPSAATPGGGPGTPGQGGGGGGGAKPCAAGKAGPSGGGGGGGGCGGNAGNAGQSGGASLGLVALSATITLHTVTITTNQAGNGGLGGDGQAGAAGGQPGGAGGANSCGGGKGGQGGRGGSGGGGAGGPSVAIAVLGTTVPDLATTSLTHAAAGAGALGGDADASAKGADGLACKTLDFGDMSSCTP